MAIEDVRLPGRRVAGLPDCVIDQADADSQVKVAGLSGRRVAGSPGCRVAGLPG